MPERLAPYLAVSALCSNVSAVSPGAPSAPPMLAVIDTVVPNFAIEDVAVDVTSLLPGVDVEIPTGQPLVYELNDDLSVRDSFYLSERAA